MGGPFSQQVSQEAMELLQRAEGQGEGACAVTVLPPQSPHLQHGPWKVFKERGYFLAPGGKYNLYRPFSGRVPSFSPKRGPVYCGKWGAWSH